MASVWIGPHPYEPDLARHGRCKRCEAAMLHPVHQDNPEAIGIAELGEQEPDAAELRDEADRRAGFEDQH